VRGSLAAALQQTAPMPVLVVGQLVFCCVVVSAGRSQAPPVFFFFYFQAKAAASMCKSKDNSAEIQGSTAEAVGTRANHRPTVLLVQLQPSTFF
jgi:hypothetical protein